jgi:hypothetical protein
VSCSSALALRGRTGTPGRDRLDLADARRRRVAEVRLVEQDDGTRAALPGHDEVTLDAARVVIFVEPRDEEDRVDVGRHTCSAVRVPAARRENLLLRGSTAWIMVCPSLTRVRVTTQSPTAGMSSGPSA